MNLLNQQKSLLDKMNRVSEAYNKLINELNELKSLLNEITKTSAKSNGDNEDIDIVEQIYGVRDEDYTVYTDDDGNIMAILSKKDEEYIQEQERKACLSLNYIDYSTFDKAPVTRIENPKSKKSKKNKKPKKTKSLKKSSKTDNT